MKSLRSIIDEIYHLFIPKSKKGVLGFKAKEYYLQVGFSLDFNHVIFSAGCGGIGFGVAFLAETERKETQFQQHALRLGFNA
jgi:hypothetical protein